MRLVQLVCGAHTLLAAADLPAGSILQFDQATLVQLGIQLFNTLVIILILAYFLYKPVKKFMTARTERLRSEAEESARELQAAAELREKYEALIGNADKERDEIITQGRLTGQQRGDEIIAEARHEAANIFRNSMEELRQERENASDEMRRAIIELSTQMASKFVSVSIDEETQDRLLEESIKHLEESPWIG